MVLLQTSTYCDLILSFIELQKRVDAVRKEKGKSDTVNRGKDDVIKIGSDLNSRFKELTDNYEKEAKVLVF